MGLGIFLLACLTDAVDGYVARKMGQKTVLGSYIDPIADKLLLLTGFLSLSFMGHLPPSMKIPAWVTISVVARDILIFIGSAMIFVIQGSLKAEPIFVGKITTVFQMSTLWVALIAAPKFLQNAFLQIYDLHLCFIQQKSSDKCHCFFVEFIVELCFLGI